VLGEIVVDALNEEQHLLAKLHTLLKAKVVTFQDVYNNMYTLRLLQDKNQKE